MKKKVLICLLAFSVLFSVACNFKIGEVAQAVEEVYAENEKNSKSESKLYLVTCYQSDGSIIYEDEYSNGYKIKTRYYNDDGSIRSECEYDANGNEIGPGIKWGYEYDAAGNLLKSIHYKNDGADYWDEYVYNIEGKISKETHYNKFGSFDYWREYEYKQNGYVVTTYNADRTISHWEENEYDKKGNVIKTTFYFSDGTIGWWTENEYDTEGNLSISYGYGADGTQGSWTEYVYYE